ncbi:MAG: transposase [Oscillospiraceae bacterium]|nr:transposase [Oscillospiraceae bacterium]
MCMRSGDQDSLQEIIRDTAIEILGLPFEVASSFANIATTRVTGFYLRFDNIPDSLTLKNVVFDGNRFVAEWESISSHADCPKCGKTSEKAHSRHPKNEMVQDIGINGKGLWHRISRKAYICTNEHCIQKRFLEGFPGLIEKRRSRMTAEFVNRVIDTAVNTSSRAAEKILKAQGAEISRDTIIRVILRRGAKQIEENFYGNASEVVNAGIDDINLRKGDSSTSCMVIVNLDTGKLLGIARGTTGETAEQALAMFPNLSIVSRDRGTAMASAANALGKTSVADRFHITSNMHDAIKKTLREHLPASIYIPIGESWVCISADNGNDELFVVGIPASLTEADIKQRARMAHLSAKAEIKYRNTLRVLELTLQGKHADEISGIIGIPVENVRKLRSEMRETISSVEKKIDEFIAEPNGSAKKQKSVTTSARHSSKSIVEPYRDTVVAMRKEGKSHWTIHNEICKLGFEGSHSSVDNYIIKLERENSIDAEIMEERSVTNDWFGAIPDRPERISVRIYTASTVYKRVLAKIRESRRTRVDEGDDSSSNQPNREQSKKKTVPSRLATG